MHSKGYSSCPVCVSVSLRHSSGTHATKLQTRHSTPMDRVSCLLQNLFGCSVAKLEHFLAKSVNHFVCKRRTLYTTLGISHVQYFIRTCIVCVNCPYVCSIASTL